MKDDVKFFRNPNNFHPVTGEPLMPGSKEQKKVEKFFDKITLDKLFGDSEKHLLDVIQKIRDISLDSKFIDNQEQQVLLVKKKKQAEDLIYDVLTKAGEYIEKIQDMQEFKRENEKLDQENYLKELEALEKSRSASHDALISNINIANRFISLNFGNLREDVIEEWEEGESEMGRTPLYAKRVEFSKNIICPNKLNLDDRKQITDWALHISESMTELNDKIKGSQ